jgi:hypothetical protein
MARQLVWIGPFLASAAFSGCSAGMIPVQGKLVRNGDPYHPAANEQVLLSFETIDCQPERSFSGLVKRDGTFTVLGTGGAGIPPGKYRIRIRIIPYGTTEEPDSAGKRERSLSGAGLTLSGPFHK